MTFNLESRVASELKGRNFSADYIALFEDDGIVNSYHWATESDDFELSHAYAFVSRFVRG